MGPLVALDVHYDDDADAAGAAALWFADWPSADPDGERVLRTAGLLPYVPGQFYERELPCLLPLAAALVGELQPRRRDDPRGWRNSARRAGGRPRRVRDEGAERKGGAQDERRCHHGSSFELAREIDLRLR